MSEGEEQLWHLSVTHWFNAYYTSKIYAFNAAIAPNHSRFWVNHPNRVLKTDFCINIIAYRIYFFGGGGAQKLMAFDTVGTVN